MINVIMIVMLIAFVSAGALFLFSGRTNIDLGDGADVETNLPETLIASAGDYYEYTASIENLANQDVNLAVNYWLEGDDVTLEDNDAKIKVYDSSNGLLIDESSTVSAGIISLNSGEINFLKDAIENYNLTVEFAIGAELGNYTLGFDVLPGTQDFE